MENGTQSNLNSKIVYDCLDPSPYYSSIEQYFNEFESVDLGPGDEPAEQPKKTKSTPAPVQKQKINRYY